MELSSWLKEINKLGNAINEVVTSEQNPTQLTIYLQGGTEGKLRIEYVVHALISSTGGQRILEFEDSVAQGFNFRTAKHRQKACEDVA